MLFRGWSFLKRPYTIIYDIDGPVMLTVRGKKPVKVCEIVNGNPQVVQRHWKYKDKFIIRDARFGKVVKRYDSRKLEDL